MRFAIFSGTAGCGKTSVILHACKHLMNMGHKPVVVKIDCIATDDDKFYQANGIPSIKGLAKDMCPDHFSTYNMEDMFSWANEKKASALLIETAGYCLRCSPYIRNCLGIFVADVTQGISMPLKVGPMLSLADMVVTIKGDVVSQAEREVFARRVGQVNPKATIVEVNGLTGYGCREVAETIYNSPEITDLPARSLKERAPFAVCTLCTGEVRVAKKHHRGLLRSIDGIEAYKGE
jgi:Ni2+-binding GTPase involved in maturation of urease and hydrogenase